MSDQRSDAQFVRRVELACTAAQAFDWHARPGALERLMPPWENARVLQRGDGLRPGSRVVLQIRVGPIPLIWEAVHGELVPGRRFTDRQLRGPFAKWEHTHELTPNATGTCTLEDRIIYRLPFGILGGLLGSTLVRSRIESLFNYRHETTSRDIKAHYRQNEDRMKIVISGATGLVGTHLAPFLTTGGHEVVRMTRGGHPSARPSVSWDPAAGSIDAAGLEGTDAVVHLAGESIAEGRWTQSKKRRIRESRVKGTRLLCETLARLERPPKVLVAASAIGWYGDRGSEELDESATGGSGFLSDVCREWEAATHPARDAGIRVVNLRLGIILSPRGGALAKMLTPFRMGAGGVLGDGKQYMSWIAIDDLVGVIQHALTNESVSGPVNAVAPKPVTNREFTKTLGAVLSRPTVIPMPGFAARIAFGEMADALLLSSTNVFPAKLSENGYKFRYPELEVALRHMLGKGASRAS